MQVVVRLAGGDLRLEASPDLNLTAAVRAQRPDLPNRQLRFFVNGRPFKSTDLQGSQEVLYVHCFAGRILSAEELEREWLELGPPVEPVQPAQPAQEEAPRGFDRLRGMGFNDEDVASLRAQFTDIYGTSAEADPAEQQQLEDLWIDNGDMSPYTSRVNDLACILVGVFGGVWSLLLLRWYVFTRRQSATMLFGLGINLVFSVFHCLT